MHVAGDADRAEDFEQLTNYLVDIGIDTIRRRRQAYNVLHEYAVPIRKAPARFPWNVKRCKNAYLFILQQGHACSVMQIVSESQWDRREVRESVARLFQSGWLEIVGVSAKRCKYYRAVSAQSAPMYRLPNHPNLKGNRDESQ